MYETGKKYKSFLFKVAIKSLLSASQCQICKAKTKNLLRENSNLLLEYFDNAVTCECCTSGLSQACTPSSSKLLRLHGVLVL